MSAMELYKSVLMQNANLKAYYRFESGQETTDSSTSGFNLTAIGTPSYSTGKFGNAVTVSSGNNLYRNSTSDLDITTGAFSIGVWVKISSVQDSDLIGKIDSNAQYPGYCIDTYNNGGNMAFSFYCITNFGTGTYDVAQKTINLNDGNWHLIVATRPSSGGVIRLWIDGAMVSSATNNNRNVTNSAKFSIGSRNAGGSRPFAGNIDDAFHFNTELSADQIKELYEGRILGEFWPQAGLVAGYHLNGNSTDFSGNGYTLDISTSPSLAGIGKFRNCIDLGTNNTSKVANIPAQNAGITGGVISILGWINTPTITSANDHESFINQGDVGTKVSYNIFLGSTGIGVARLKGAVAWQETSQVAISANTWYFVGLTYDLTNLNLYINGDLKYSVAASGNGTGDVVSGLVIGSRSDTSVTRTYADGKIDEVLFFNRVLSANEIRKIYGIQRFGEF